MTCAIYCRLSREDGDRTQESESIQNQKALLTRYAAEQGWEIFRIYCDEDYSGADRGRPDWNAMLADAKAGKFGIILCKTQSRFTRDMELVERYLHGLFPLWGIRFISVVDNIDTGQSGNKKARQISGLINEWYLEDLSENVRAVLDQKRRAGQHIGSFAAYGYRKDPADRNHLLIDEEAAAAVQTVFRLFLSGTGTQRIAQILNERGIPSPAQYKRNLGLAFSNGAGADTPLWNHTAVGRILRNEIYTGTMVQGVRRKVSYKSKQLAGVPPEEWIRVKHTHEAVISQEIFDEVQRRLASRPRAGGAGQIHPLAGKVFCLDCQSAMRRLTTSYRGISRSYLECGRYAADRGCPSCTKHTIRLDRLTALVEERLRRHLERCFGLPAEDLLPSLSQPPPQENEAARELRSLKRRSERIEQAVKTLYLDRAAGLVPPEECSRLLASFRRDLEALSRRAAVLESRSSGTAAGTGPEPPESPLSGPFGRRLIEQTVGRIEIGERDPGAGTQPVIIRWNF